MRLGKLAVSYARTYFELVPSRCRSKNWRMHFTFFLTNAIFLIDFE